VFFSHEIQWMAPAIGKRLRKRLVRKPANGLLVGSHQKRVLKALFLAHRPRLNNYRDRR
jgi:hypothetical protein